MSADRLADEVQELRTDVQALTQGLLTQQQMLTLMDEKLTCLLEAATRDDEHPLQELLAEIAVGMREIAEGQAEVIRLLRSPVH